MCSHFSTHYIRITQHVSDEQNKTIWQFLNFRPWTFLFQQFEKNVVKASRLCSWLKHAKFNEYCTNFIDIQAQRSKNGLMRTQVRLAMSANEIFDHGANIGVFVGHEVQADNRKLLPWKYCYNDETRAFANETRIVELFACLVQLLLHFHHPKVCGLY